MNTDSISQSDPPDDSSQKITTDNILISMHVKEQAVYAALIANLGIFALKLTFGIIGRSSAMLSEAAHSFADSFNSFCLIIGLKRGNRPADQQHPFGYGLEANVWTLFACLLMLLSACVSIYWGLDRIFHNTNIEELKTHYNLIAIALGCSMLFEAWAVNNANKAILFELKQNYKDPFSALIISFKNIKHVKSPTTRFVWFEDTAAFCGAGIALIAVTVAKYFSPDQFAHLPDGIASLLIGFILFFLASYLFTNYLSKLGASAKPNVEQQIKDIALNINGITEIYDLKTMDMGSSGLIVNMEIEVAPDIQVRELDDITEKLDEKLKEKISAISHVNIEVQADETEENWSEKYTSLIEEGVREGVINHREAKILSNFYNFTDTVVEEVMVPRTEINSIDKSQTIQELINIVIDTGHTRIPVCDETIDNIIGLIHSKDIFKIFKNGGVNSDIKLTDFVRELPIVPENKSASIMLNELITNKNQMALVADEHGGIAGLVTIEDLIEEIFGEIWDEYDVEIIERKRIDQNTFLLSSKIDIEEINERYGFDISLEEFQTIGGYLFGSLGRVPVVGDEVKIEDATFTITSMNGHKIEYIRLYRPTGIVDRIEEEERKQIEREKANGDSH